MRPDPAAVAVFVNAHIPLLAALTAVSAGSSLAIEQSSSSQLRRWSLGGRSQGELPSTSRSSRPHMRQAPKVCRRVELRARIGAGLALVALALLWGALDPVVFIVGAASVLVGVVVLKLRAARPVVARARDRAAPREPASP